MTARILSATELKAYGLRGIAFEISRPAGSSSTGPVALQIPEKYLTGQYGANYASRLQWTQFPATTSSAPTTADTTAVPSATVAKNDALVLTPTIAQPMVVAATTSPVSTTGTGTFAATPLNAATSWDVSAQTGDFSWSVPFRTPPAAAGPSPSALGLSYDSQSVDGISGGTNNQPSSVGIGWNLTGGGNIQRQYVSCAQDSPSPDTASGDLCWNTSNATMTLDGHSSELVLDNTTQQWKMLHDDGTRIQLLNSTSGPADPCVNGDNNHECWEVTTTDGTEYFFGLNELPGWATGDAVTNSTWTVPVFGNDSGEPCHASTFAASDCTQAWQWNLDYVKDVHGNAEALYYDTETNKYDVDSSTSHTTSYIRGGALKEIQYGIVGNTPYSTTVKPSDEVDFTYNPNGRCVTSCTSQGTTWTGAAVNAAHPTDYPDVPWDLYCSASTCSGKNSPSFWTDAELLSVTTKALVSGAYSNVDTWTLAHTLPAAITGDATSAMLWLTSVAHQGTSSTATEPNTTFTGESLPNRVWASGSSYTPLNEYRVSAVQTSLGAQVVVNYSTEQCTTSMKAGILASPQSNNYRCYPEWWSPGVTTAPIHDLFNKYVVTSMVSNPETGGGSDASLETDYDYSAGTPAWRYNNSTFTPTKYRDWSDYAGYDKVRINVGSSDSPATQQSTLYTFFQGLNGDRASTSGGTKTAYVDGSTTLLDQPWFAGRTRETQTYNGAQSAAQLLSTSITTPTAYGPTATPASGTQRAYMVGDGDSITTEPISSGGSRTEETKTTYSIDGYFLPTQVENLNSDAVSTCTSTSYATPNATAWIIGLPSEVAVVGTDCADAPTATYPAAGISDTRTAYDGLAVGAAPILGDATSTQIVHGYSGTTAASANWVTQSTDTYDSLGRTLTVTDILGRQTSHSYVPSASGPMTSETVTSPAPKTGDPGWTTTTAYNQQWGEPTTVTDPNGEVSTEAFDGLGRLIGVWKPDRSTSLSPTVGFTYTLSTTAASSVETSTLGPGTTLESYDLYDGLGRVVQSQSAAETGGSVMTDTAYDASGHVVRTNNAYWTDSVAPSGVLFVPTSEVQIPSETLTAFDGDGRQVSSTVDSYGTIYSQSSTAYVGADETDVTPPAGGTPTSTFVNSLGQKTKLVQYLASTPAGSGHEATTYAYDPQGQMTEMVDPDGNTWSWGFDVLGHKITADDPDSGTTTSAYNDAGDLLTSTDARNVTLSYSYDNQDRKTAEFTGTGSSAIQLAGWTYDPSGAKGQLASSTTYTGATAGAAPGTTGLAYVEAVTGYTSAYLPTGSTVSIPTGAPAFGGTSYTTGETYNAAELRSSSVYPANEGGLSAETVRTSYDGLGNANSVGTSAGSYANTLFTPLGQVEEQSRPSSTELYTDYAYVPATNAVSEIKTTIQNSTTTSTLEDNTYGYDAAGEVKSIAMTSAALASGETQCFNYDHLQNLTSAWTPSDGNCSETPTSSTLGGVAPYWDDYTVNAANGNRLSETNNATFNGGAATTSTYHYPASGSSQPHAVEEVDQVSGTSTNQNDYGYDANGDANARPGETLTYDPNGKVATVVKGTDTESNIYGPDGTLLLQTDSTAGSTLFLGDTELHAAAGSSTVTGTRTYSANGMTVAERTTTAGISGNDLIWLSTDNQGTVSQEVDAVTGVVATRQFDPFGQVIGSGATWSDDHGFLNAANSAQGDLTLIGAREYDPNLGRFLSVDSLLDPSNPEQVNGYSYADNSPVSNDDPTGDMLVDSDGGPTGGNAATRYRHSSSPNAAGNNVSGESVASQKYYGDYAQVKQSDAPGCGYDYDPCASTQYLSNRDRPILTPSEQGTEDIADGITIIGVCALAIEVCAAAGAGEGVAEGTDALDDSMAGGRGPVLAGQAGENAVREVYDIGRKVSYETPAGKLRIADGMTGETVSEVKNVNYQAFTRQLKDALAYAQDTGRTLDLYVRGGENPTVLSGPLQEAINNPKLPIMLHEIPSSPLP